MKTENTLSGIALMIASLSIVEVLNISLALVVGVTAILLNIRKYKAEKARESKEKAEKELLVEQLKTLKNEK
ncbi:hypothetical protein [Aquimarina algiphila]|uniref:Holin n=1 Tax=Aquimarina algiphila TaxID=2047982 RepID=A0A554VA16_9FLAO|nr:hypothetical protein [Aquimarina algiphila]TSE02428.1 hypothetical protein FOF46_30840 [Aquimarina algiphila]TSE02600.1 hypothetical protein FOF46_30725 [Aquimarina algiphila]